MFEYSAGAAFFSDYARVVGTTGPKRGKSLRGFLGSLFYQTPMEHASSRNGLCAVARAGCDRPLRVRRIVSGQTHRRIVESEPPRGLIPLLIRGRTVYLPNCNKGSKDLVKETEGERTERDWGTRGSALAVLAAGCAVAFWLWPDDLNSSGASLSAIGSAIIAIGSLAIAALIW